MYKTRYGSNRQPKKGQGERLSKFGQSLKIHEDQLEVRNVKTMYAWLSKEIEFG